MAIAKDLEAFFSLELAERARTHWARKKREERFLSARADAFAGANAEEKSRPASFEMTVWGAGGEEKSACCGRSRRIILDAQTRMTSVSVWGEEKRDFIPQNARDGAEVSLRRPKHSQERMRKKKSARSVRNDGGVVSAVRRRKSACCVRPRRIIRDAQNANDDGVVALKTELGVWVAGLGHSN